MSKVKILVQGYAKKVGDAWLASSSTVLIINGKLKILVDPGTNKNLLLKALKGEGLEPKDINIVFLTHYHLDHALNIRLFPDKDIYDGDTISKDDKIIEYSGNIPGTDIQVISTPGHAHEHCSLLVETEEGKIAVAGDIFYWLEGQEQKTDEKNLLKCEDPFVKDKEALLSSREKLIKLADFIIPGHGKIFKVGDEDQA